MTDENELLKLALPIAQEISITIWNKINNMPDITDNDKFCLETFVHAMCYAALIKNQSTAIISGIDPKDFKNHMFNAIDMMLDRISTQHIKKVH